jgi:hypothetical protein
LTYLHLMPLTTLEFLVGPTGRVACVAALDYAFARFKKIGMPVPESSRLMKAYRLLQNPDSDRRHLPQSVKLRRELAEAHKIANDFHDIARAINPLGGPPTSKLRRDLARAYYGNLDPGAEDTKSVTARNLQFQVWLASWYTAGDKAIRYEEPDLKVAYWFRWHGVAAKRIQSPSKILTRIQEAAKQVRNRVGQGFIAVAFDNYSPALAKRLATLRNPLRFYNRLPELDTALEWCRTDAPWIRAVLLFGCLIRWRLKPPPPRLTLEFPERVWCIPRDKRDREYLWPYYEELLATYRSRVEVASRPNRGE